MAVYCFSHCRRGPQLPWEGKLKKKIGIVMSNGVVDSCHSISRRIILIAQVVQAAVLAEAWREEPKLEAEQ